METNLFRSRKPHPRTFLKASKKPQPGYINEKTGKFLFGAAELLAALTSGLKPGSSPTFDSVNIKTAVNIQEIGQLIKNEYEKIFWATGNMDTSLWSSNATFSDPFSSFGGEGSTRRFKQNANQLGALVLGPIY